MDDEGRYAAMTDHRTPPAIWLEHRPAWGRQLLSQDRWLAGAVLDTRNWKMRGMALASEPYWDAPLYFWTPADAAARISTWHGRNFDYLVELGQMTIAHPFDGEIMETEQRGSDDRYVWHTRYIVTPLGIFAPDGDLRAPRRDLADRPLAVPDEGRR